MILIDSFNIVDYESAYREIEAGVARLLANMEPNPLSQPLGRLYLLSDIPLIQKVWRVQTNPTKTAGKE